jgi:hypothetical protein
MTRAHLPRRRSGIGPGVKFSYFANSFASSKVIERGAREPATVVEL